MNQLNAVHGRDLQGSMLARAGEGRLCAVSAATPLAPAGKVGGAAQSSVRECEENNIRCQRKPLRCFNVVQTSCQKLNGNPVLERSGPAKGKTSEIFWIRNRRFEISVGNDKPISNRSCSFQKKVAAFWRGKWVPPPVQSQGQQPQQLEGGFFFFFKSFLLPVCLPPSVLSPRTPFFFFSFSVSLLVTFSIESQDRVDISTLHRNSTGSRLSPSAACNCRIPPIDLHQLSLFPIDDRINFPVLGFRDSH